MAGDWRKSPIAQIALIVVIVLMAGSFLVRCKSKDSDAEEEDFGRRITLSVGAAAADESARVLGANGGKAALILPPYGTEDMFPGSRAQIFREGFDLGAAKHPSLKVLGHFTPPGEGHSDFSLALFQEAREKYPEAELFVSFWGVPNLKTTPLQQWQAASLPKLVIVESRAELLDAAQSVIQSGMAQSVILSKGDAQYPETKPTDSQEIFNLFYQVLPARNTP